MERAKQCLFISFFASFLLILSCSREVSIHGLFENSVSTKDFSSIYIPEERRALYVDTEEYNLLSHRTLRTKSGIGEISLENLLDKTNYKVREFNGYLFEEIPFIRDDEYYASYGVGEVAPAESATFIKKNLVQITALNSDYEKIFIATLITNKAYSDTYPDYDYLERPNFTGAILFSSLSGEFLTVRLYSNGRILPAERINSKEHIQDIQLFYVSLFENSETKSGDDVMYWDGSPSYCFGYIIESSFCYASTQIDDIGNSNGSNTSTSHGGLNQPDLEYNRKDDGYSFLPIPMEIQYRVRISTNCPEDIRMNLDDPYNGTYHPLEEQISITGETIADYVEGSYISVSPKYVTSHPSLQIEDFAYWSGYFRDFDKDYIVFKVLCDINSTAYYGSDMPCRDSQKGITNPLYEMSIAPAGGWNYKGGTFGMTRKQLIQVDTTTCWIKKRHDGLDLKAIPGTPVYSLYQGVVELAYSDAPNYYTKGYGNELRIRSINKAGEVFIVQYAHLNYGTPFATNPRTGNVFSVNDIVYQGDLIGYSGKTGNAFKDSDVPVKHLHLGVKSNGKWVDPKDYINGTVDTLNLKNGQIRNIRCD